MIKLIFKTFSFILMVVLVGVGILITLQTVMAVNISSSVIVGNAVPSASAVSLNGGSAITLTSNTTTTLYVNFTVSDNNGCSDVFTNGNVTSTIFRSGVTGSCTANNLNCYVVSSVTNNCTGSSTSANATATFQVYYFADATDASSSYAAQNWQAQIFVKDGSAATGTATSTGVELNTLNAINVTTSSINYGTLAAGSNTGATNQIATSTNAGNSSTTLQLYASQTLTSGANSIATSSQHYATSSFTFGGAEQLLSGTAATVSGFLLTAPTSTNAVSKAVFWGLEIPNGTATGTYTGVNVFSSLFQP